MISIVDMGQPLLHVPVFINMTVYYIIDEPACEKLHVGMYAVYGYFGGLG